MYSNLYSAFAAVIILHVALGNFIYRAYFNTEAIPGFDKLEKEDWISSTYISSLIKTFQFVVKVYCVVLV